MDEDLKEVAKENPHSFKLSKLNIFLAVIKKQMLAVSSHEFLGEMISKRYQNRNVIDTDPNPIEINCNINGPLPVSRKYILCDACGSVLRPNYLITHRESGACVRLINKYNNLGPLTCNL